MRIIHLDPITQRFNLRSATHSAFQITEVLSHIFSFLNKDSIISCRHVCRQWAAVARLLLVLKDNWCENMPSLEVSLFMDRLAWIDTLEIYHVQSDGYHQMSAYMSNLMESMAKKSWEVLTQAMESRAARKKLELRRLILNGGRGDVMTTFPVTSSYELVDRVSHDEDALANSPLLRILGSSSLTKLAFSKMQFGQMDLNALLKCCPMLIDLFIEYRPLSEHVTWQEGLSPEPFQPQFPLQSLTLRNVRMKQHSLEAFLGRCSGLRTLEVVFLRVVPSTSSNPLSSVQDRDIFDGIAFFKSLKSSCSLINKLQFSLANQSLAQEEYMTLIECFPRLRTFGATSVDLAVCEIGFQVLNQYINHLTTLEIHSNKSFPGGQGEEPGATFAPVLHKFLCSSPLLLHLRAKGVAYSSKEYMDLAGKKYLGQTQIWTCRDLLTLQLSFSEPTNWEVWSEVNSRVLFGYISRVCPSLKELWIYRGSISLLLEGGLCLLTRCKDLESLTVKTGMMRGKATSLATSKREGTRPDMLEVEWVADWIENNPGWITRKKRSWKHVELVKRIVNHEHGWSKRRDDICEACESERIKTLNGMPCANPQVVGPMNNTIFPRLSLQSPLPHGILGPSGRNGDESLPIASPSGCIDALCGVGELQEIIDWMEEEPGFSSPSFECWPRLRSFKLQTHINRSNKTVWAWKNKSAAIVQQQLRPEIGFKVELVSENMQHHHWWRE